MNWFMIFNYVVFGYFITLSLVYFVTSIFAFRQLRQYAYTLDADPDLSLLSSGFLPPITILAPAYNEQETCVESTKSLLALEYPDYEVLIINDGSKDATFERLREAFQLKEAFRMPVASIPAARIKGLYQSQRIPNLWVIDKENGGKADSLNTGINFCTNPLFCVVDADSLLEKTALTRIVRPFIENSDTVAVGGIIRIVNGSHVESGAVTQVNMPKSLLAKFQVLEYFRAFLGGRMGWEAFNATFIISGAFGLFHRQTIVEIGGYSTKLTGFETVGEDIELVIRLHHHCRKHKKPYSISYVPDPVAWTECPESLKVLHRQRSRWQRGLLESTIRHKGMLFNPRYGRIGMLALPYHLILEGFGPVIEFFSYISFFYLLFIQGAASLLFVTTFFMVAFVLGMVISFIAISLEQLTFRRYPKLSDMAQLFVLSIIESFGYRQLNSYWRIHGVITFLLGRKDWGKMERKGFSKAK
ncbi:MAG: glycosyltransferase family 2 protein [Pseudohongiella sp.]|nr:glycosyltransferase family 2 protein [Pseudohongiella sp.]